MLFFAVGLVLSWFLAWGNWFDCTYVRAPFCLKAFIMIRFAAIWLVERLKAYLTLSGLKASYSRLGCHTAMICDSDISSHATGLSTTAFAYLIILVLHLVKGIFLCIKEFTGTFMSVNNIHQPCLRHLLRGLIIPPSPSFLWYNQSGNVPSHRLIWSQVE